MTKSERQTAESSSRFEASAVSLDDAGDDLGDLLRRSPGPSVTSVALLADQALKRALTRRERRLLRKSGALVVLCKAPSVEWIRPMTDAFLRLAPGARVVSGDKKPRSFEDPDGNALSLINLGVPVIAVTHDFDLLSAVLVRAADLVLDIPGLSVEMVAAAIRRLSGATPVGLVAGHIAGLDLLDVAAALRSGSRAKDCVARLLRASQAVAPGELAAPVLTQLGGYGEAGDWALGLVGDVERGRRDGIGVPLGSALFFGPPGTGKTMLARSIAATAGVPLLTTSVADWFSQSAGFLDSIIKEYTRFFDRLESSGFIVGFIDELDALPSRAKLSPRGADFWTSAITGFLLRVDRLRARNPAAVLLAATNYIDRVDPALLRPGRFDRRFEILPPDEDGRADILRHHAGPGLSEADARVVARVTDGATGAVLAGYVRGAKRRAEAAGRPMVLADLMAESAPADPRSPQELRAVAIHEAAHAIIAYRLGLQVPRTSIIRSGDAGGVTHLAVDGAPSTRALVELRVIVALAGRAADMALGNGPDGGAASDLAYATRVLAIMHACWGLGETLTVRARPADIDRNLTLDPTLARTVEADLARLLGDAVRLVEANRRAILALAEILLKRRVAVAADIAAVADRHCPSWRGEAPGARRPR
ncbi:AAA family ATPase [Alsobacter sp. KACC 23698]|uniref:AAA family ATPase n=1 Tax=Alsobacter sp. KACC 23698 TaxID=3149229 RepID=A0AAU7JJP1_9HYPH